MTATTTRVDLETMYRPNVAEFVVGAARSDQFPKDDLPEIAFAGRSNVGKSSLLNMLVGRRALARTSATPGKTQQINFFRLDRRIMFVDLPGYGYARVSKTDRQAWALLIERYLSHRPNLRLVVSLIDIRHPPTALDRDMFAWLDAIGVPFLVVLTKYDKVSPTLASTRQDDVARLVDGMSGCRGILAVSSTLRHNRELLWRTLLTMCTDGGK